MQCNEFSQRVIVRVLCAVCTYSGCSLISFSRVKKAKTSRKGKSLDGRSHVDIEWSDVPSASKVENREGTSDLYRT